MVLTLWQDDSMILRSMVGWKQYIILQDPFSDYNQVVITYLHGAVYKYDKSHCVCPCSLIINHPSVQLISDISRITPVRRNYNRIYTIYTLVKSSSASAYPGAPCLQPNSSSNALSSSNSIRFTNNTFVIQIPLCLEKRERWKLHVNPAVTNWRWFYILSILLHRIHWHSSAFNESLTVCKRFSHNLNAAACFSTLEASSTDVLQINACFYPSFCLLNG